MKKIAYGATYNFCYINMGCICCYIVYSEDQLISFCSSEAWPIATTAAIPTWEPSPRPFVVPQ